MTRSPDWRAFAFAINRDDGATVHEFSLAAQREREIVRLPGERIVAGHAAGGSIAILHGRLATSRRDTTTAPPSLPHRVA